MNIKLVQSIEIILNLERVLCKPGHGAFSLMVALRHILRTVFHICTVLYCIIKVMHSATIREDVQWPGCLFDVDGSKE
jgi:hypothetical protein